MKYFQKFNFLTIFFTLAIAGNYAIGQNRNMVFREFSKNQGLSNVFVNAIIQDKRGFLWIGTWNGLHRYDGYKFKVYKSVENDSSTLFSDGIMRLAEDNNGRIWIICHTGLSMYDEAKDRFVRISSNDTSTGTYFTRLLVDSKGILWIGTNNKGVWNLPVNDSTDFSKIKPHFKQYTHDNNKPKSVGANSISCIYEDRKSNIWINAGNKIIDRYNPQTDNFDHYPINIPGIEKQTDIVTLQLEDSAGLYWLGSSGAGLISWDKERNIFKQYLYRSGKNSLSANIVTHIRQAKDGMLWISTDGGGISFYDNKTGLFDYCKNETTNPNSLSSNAVNLTFEDRSGIIWICTFNMGLNKFEAANTNFRHITPNPFDKNSLSNKSVTSILEDKEGNFWIGTDGGGLNFWNNRTKNFRHFLHDPSNPNSISGNVVVSLAEDFEGNIWIGTYTKGLNCYKRKEDKFIRYMNVPGDNYSLSHNNVWALLEDSKHNLWIGTLEGTLNLFDRKTNRFYSYKNNPNDPGSFVGVYTTDLFEDSRHCLWIATSGGLEMIELYKYDFNLSSPKLHFNHYRHNNLINSISTNSMSCIYEDHERNMWFGANSGGLNRLNTKTNEFVNITEKDGLPDNTIRRILEDNDNNIWVSSEKGISKFDPQKRVFHIFNIANDFSNASCRSKDGRLLFGESNGFIVFSPRSLSTNTVPPRVVLTDFKIYNGSVAVGQKINGNIVLDESITESKLLTLPYKENFISFEFSALDFTNPEKNRYAYTMEGFDNQWRSADAENRIATYTNLDAGRYTFRVKASNNDGVWNEEGVSLTIIITPPYWQTLWFQLLGAIVVAGIIYWIYQWWMQARDLALQKRMEAALMKERNLLRTVIDNVPDAIYAKDLKFRKTISNRTDVNNIGRASEADVLGKDDYELFPKEMAEGFIADDRTVIETGQPVINREEYVIDGKGRKHFLVTTKIPLRDEHNQIIGLIGIGHDITGRKLAEEALQNERNLLRTLIDNLPDAVFVKDLESKKIISNPADVRSMGAQSEAEVIGKTDDVFFSADTAATFFAEDQSVLQSGIPILGREGSYFDKQGNKVNVLSFKIPLRDEHGAIVGIVGALHDITDQKRSQEALQRERTILRTLIDNLPDAVSIKDVHYRKVIANLADVHFMGLQSEAEALGKDDFELFSKELAEGFIADDRTVIQTGQQVINREEYVIDEEGQKRWLSTSKLPLRDEKGQTIGLVCISRDITERKFIEEALQNERNLLRTLIDNLPDKIFFKDVEGRYLLDNLSHLRSMGLTDPNGIIGKNTFDFNPPELAQHYTDDEKQVIQNKKEMLDKEELAVHRDTGEQRWHLTSRVPLIDNNGNVVGIVGIARDITEHKRAEVERERLITELQQAIADIKVLSGLVPICSSCKKIRDDKGYWTQLEGYIQAHSQAKFSHGVCPDCLKKLYPNFVPKKIDGGVS